MREVQIKYYPMLVFLFVVCLFAVGCVSNTPERSDHHVVRTWGERGSGDGQFREPVGIAVLDGSVVVADAGNSRVQVFDTTGNYLRSFGDDILNRPMHLGHRGDTLFIPDFLNDNIVIATVSGEVIGNFGQPGAASGQFDAPGSVSAHRRGQLYVTDFYNHRIQVLDTEGNFQSQLGITGSEGADPGQFTYPTSAAFLADGSSVVGDAYNHRIQVFASDGSFQWMKPEGVNWADSVAGRFNVATAVAVSPDNKIYVADFYNHRIQVFNSEGTWLTMFGSFGRDPGNFDRPVGLAFDEAGVLYVVDFGNNRIQKVQTSH